VAGMNRIMEFGEYFKVFFFHLIHLLQRNPGSKKEIKFFTGYFGYTQIIIDYDIPENL